MDAYPEVKAADQPPPHFVNVIPGFTRWLIEEVLPFGNLTVAMENHHF